MATTQYIGARYVPIFAEPTEWDKTRQYEPLTIVTHEGNSYTSRQFVPTGIEIANEDFWVLTGNFNAQVEQYRNEVKSYDGRITTAQTTADNAKSLAETNDAKLAGTADSGLKTLITNESSRATDAESELESKINTTNTNIAHLDAQMAATTGSELLNKITNNSNDIKALAERTSITNEHIVFIGDSYMEGKPSMNNYGLGQGVVDFLKLKNAHIYGNGGSGFKKAGNDGPWPGLTFNGLVERAASDLYSVADKVTKVVFQGCWNDGAIYTDDMTELIKSTVSNARTKFKNAEIYICVILCSDVAGVTSKGNVMAYGDYVNASSSSGAHFSSCRLLPFYTNASNDNIHPTEGAVKRFLAPWLASFITSGYQEDFIGNKFTDSNYANLTAFAFPFKFKFNTPSTFPYTLLQDNIIRSGAAIRNMLYVNINTGKLVYITISNTGKVTIDHSDGLAATGSPNHLMSLSTVGPSPFTQF